MQTHDFYDFPIAQSKNWKMVDFLSDMHLHESDLTTFEQWQHHMQNCTADAVFLLGDVFEMWVGDDTLNDKTSFEWRCASVISETAQRCSVFILHGNRDFLIGQQAVQCMGATLLPDATVLTLQGQRTIISHGDVLCIGDVNYQQWRHMVRNMQWQEKLLQKPLSERMQIGQALRSKSMSSTIEKYERNTTIMDADDAQAMEWLCTANAKILLHGHTHRPACHHYPNQKMRIVLSDWDATSTPVRIQIVRWEPQPSGWQRINLNSTTSL